MLLEFMSLGCCSEKVTSRHDVKATKEALKLYSLYFFRIFFEYLILSMSAEFKLTFPLITKKNCPS